MAIFESVATASFQYYMNKKKDDIIYRINMLADTLKQMDIEPPPMTQWSHSELKKCRRDVLADLAMDCHRLFPPEKT